MTMVEIERTDHNPGWRAFVTGSSRPHGWLNMEEAKWGLHPLIYTHLEFHLVQDVEKK